MSKRSRVERNSFLPNDLLCLVLGFLTVGEYLCRIRRISKRFREFVYHFTEIDATPEKPFQEILRAANPGSVRTVRVRFGIYKTDLRGLESLNNLEQLTFDAASKLEEKLVLVPKSTKTLVLSFCSTSANQEDFLSGLSLSCELTSLCLRECRLTDCNILWEPLCSLVSLSMSSCGLRDTHLEGIWCLRKLEQLDLSGNPELSNLWPLVPVTSLKTINLFDCPRVTDLTPLSMLANLKDTVLGSSPAPKIPHSSFFGFRDELYLMKRR